MMFQVRARPPQLARYLYLRQGIGRDEKMANPGVRREAVLRVCT